MSIGFRNPIQADGDANLEVNRLWIGWLLALILFLSPTGCQENFPPLSASVSTCMLGPKTVESAD